MSDQLNNRPELKPNRKNLRNNLTPAEAALWKLLKSKQLEKRKFRRQHSVGNYILDFYCHSLKLAIEVDGSIHNLNEVKQNDEVRQKQLEQSGLTFLRFSNDEIKLKADQVIQHLGAYLKEKATPSSHPLSP